MAIQSINPATNEILKTYDEYSIEKVNNIIDEAYEAFLGWRLSPFVERRELMLNAARILRKYNKGYAETISLEMGKIISESLAEVEKCAWVCEYYAENAEQILSNEKIETDASESYVRFDPIGVVLAVMPWNFPFWQVFRFAVPALMAGNAGLLKHASNVPQCALAIEDIFNRAGFPDNLFRTLLVSSKRVTDIIKNNHVKAITLTGSEPAGMKVAELSGYNLKKTVLELGGSDPFIVLADADIDTAVKVGVQARMINNGQSCIAAKRFIIEESIADEFESKFIDEMSKLNIGNPLDEYTKQGTMAREDLLLELDEQVKQSIKAGAKPLLGCERYDKEGVFYKASVLTNVAKGMPCYDEELFGPVAAIIRAQNENDAIRIANDSDFGLGASLWTNNLEKAEILAEFIESGSVFINGLVKSDPRLPFGGVKKSGYGRELSHYGIKEFVNIKTVWIK
ncbi:MAG: NAD-dependent succinate-semialdehyde dehydrogenase [Ignavibacteria bacterium]|jgi:succinate-semialdehyde dehydrogenase/glutarate-semialdehyde dehydrogenase